MPGAPLCYTVNHIIARLLVQRDHGQVFPVWLDLSEKVHIHYSWSRVWLISVKAVHFNTAPKLCTSRRVIIARSQQCQQNVSGMFHKLFSAKKAGPCSSKSGHAKFQCLMTLINCNPHYNNNLNWNRSISQHFLLLTTPVNFWTNPWPSPVWMVINGDNGGLTVHEVLRGGNFELNVRWPRATSVSTVKS